MSGKMIVLGAGASCAAIPNGDKNRKKISVMSGFVEKLGLSDILSEVVIQTDLDNHEDIYMELDNRSKKGCSIFGLLLQQKMLLLFQIYEI